MTNDASRRSNRELTVFCLLSACAFTVILGSEGVEIDLDEAGIFLSALTLILLVQVTVLYVSRRIASIFLPAAIADGLMTAGISLAFAANLYFFTFRLFEWSQKTELKVSLAGGALLLAVLFIARRHDTMRTLVSAFGVITFVVSVGQYTYTRAAIASLAGFPVEPVPVESTRNVYLIGFESLHSPKAFRDLYDVSQLPHVDYLRSQGFRLFDRSYSADMRTRRTYSRVLEFKRPLDDNDFEQRTVFSAPNTTSSSFKSGGYDVQFLYKTNHFAVKEGAFDYRYPPDAFYACSFIRKDYFYHLCDRRVVNFINSRLYRVPPIGTKKQVEHFKERVDAVTASGKPWLTIIHFGYPFHSRGDHDYRDADAVAGFRRRIRDSVPQIDRWIRESVSYVLAKDPGAAIIVMGDHGAELTRGLDLKLLPHDAERNRYFSTEHEIEDRYGAMLGVYPAGFCRNRIFEGSTTAFLMKSLIACLNGDDQPTKEETDKARLIFVGLDPVDVRKYVPAPGNDRSLSQSAEAPRKVQ